MTIPQTTADQAAEVAGQATELLDRAVSHARHAPSEAMTYAVAGVGKALLAVAAELAALRAQQQEVPR
ncbi:hypothetical protein [Nonomuraea gerenzanensis]|uniref:Uncharacterized protein n=1 Tax=Nonomuraea gerenzanensis TaxID=93944 RepID=A0A1M4BKY9_9ACTN|nr:hypothetical protein [Nonomuraea gerenzanensis]UBU10059.1 hypothetical protein LCN96_37660 [Nonomuraea gerenzanensis]SAP16316.1 hypothetical protein BN4615_P10979 [Nonomuraea gerenzanensis]